MANDKVTTHGDFALAATLATGLKERIWFAAGEDRLDPVSREALDQIASRMARIVYGEADYPQHWQHIIGFCQAKLDVLARRALKPPPRELEREIHNLVKTLPRNGEG